MPLSRLLTPALALAALLLIWLALPDRDTLGRPLPLALLLGAAFGFVLQRARFCFWCILRDWFRDHDPRGLLGILAALALGSLGYAAILGAWVPNPVAGRLPPDAHVGPVSLTLAAGAFAFGLGMAVSGSCISAHLYRLGEGAFGSLVALAGAGVGFLAGFLTWNPLYRAEGFAARPVWLPAHLGHGGAVALQLTVMAALALWLLRGRAWVVQPPPVPPLQAIFLRRWPSWAGGLLVGFIATLAYLRVGPLGVTAELGSLTRTLADQAGLLPPVLHGLDGLAGCATVVKDALLSRNGVFVGGMVLASFAAATLAGDWRPSWPGLRGLPRLFIGGVLLGWGAMVALGCTVGVILSGIMAGALSGWVFATLCLAGAWAGWRLRGRA